MKYLMTYENFEINEGLFGNLWQWIKGKFNNFISHLKGKYAEGAEIAKKWLSENTEEVKKLLVKLKEFSKEEILKLWNWVKKFVSNPEDIQTGVTESIETEGLGTMEKIAHYAGVSIKLLLSFGGIITAIMGLCAGSGPLVITGMIIAVLSWGLLSLINSWD